MVYYFFQVRIANKKPSNAEFQWWHFKQLHYMPSPVRQNGTYLHLGSFRDNKASVIKVSFHPNVFCRWAKRNIAPRDVYPLKRGAVVYGFSNLRYQHWILASFGRPMIFGWPKGPARYLWFPMAFRISILVIKLHFDGAGT